MKIIALDDEKIMLRMLVNCISAVEPDADIYPFSKASEVLEFADNNEVDVAFLDIKLRGGVSGTDVGKLLIEKQTCINIIFVTGFADYGIEAMQMHASGYIEKPVTVDDVKQEMSNLRYPVERQKREISVQCLGNFEVFVDGKPIEFANSKTKEMFAYLVDRCGSICTTREIMAILWEDGKTHDSYFKKIRRDLIQTLENLQCLDALFIQRGGLAINVKRIHCDYYEWKKKAPEENYVEEYMRQYSWGQYRTGF